jgi:hypothetical protein
MTDRRIELHWAAQVASAAGATLLEKKRNDSHANLGWDVRARALAGHPIAGKRAALRIDDAALTVLGDDSEPIATKPLRGETVASALAWLAGAFGTLELCRAEHDLPEHPVGAGARFSGEGDAELAALFAQADEALSAIAKREANASPVRCWPHHFDIATSISLGGERTIGAGLSPGDGSYSEPYWYVTPWPYPEGDLPAIAHGHWHRKGWTGAILLARGGSPQPFLDEALRASHEASRSLTSP